MMNFDRSFTENWFLNQTVNKKASLDLILHWRCNTDRFLIQVRIPTEERGYQYTKPAYSAKTPKKYYLTDSDSGNVTTFKSEKAAKKVALEILVNSFFSDVEKEIKNL